MRVCYSSGYVIRLPPAHRFPILKFRLLYEILLDEQLARPADLLEPEPACWDDLRTVHADRYLSDLTLGRLSRRAQRRMGLPWSPALVRRSRLAVQGTLQAARLALQDGIAANLAGGTHHAFPDYGEGFCVLNDVAVAIRVCRSQGLIRRALVIDLDVHQGNGTAAIFADDELTYTFSVHGERNFPFRKERSSRDVALANGIGDVGYLRVVDKHLPEVLREARPDLAVYVAGVDPVDGDRFGRLGLSRGGLIERERLVLRALHDAGIPTAIVTGGGYASTPGATADLHAVVHREAAKLWSVC